MNGPQINEEPCFLTKQVNHRSSALESDIQVPKIAQNCPKLQKIAIFDHF